MQIVKERGLPLWVGARRYLPRGGASVLQRYTCALGSTPCHGALANTHPIAGVLAVTAQLALVLLLALLLCGKLLLAC